MALLNMRVSMEQPIRKAVRDFPPGCGAGANRHRRNPIREDIKDHADQVFAPSTPPIIFEKLPPRCQNSGSSGTSMVVIDHDRGRRGKEMTIRRGFKRTRRILAHTAFHRRMMIFLKPKRSLFT